MSEIAKLNKVSKIYKLGETEIAALDKVTLSIARGEAISIMGPSGSGKTTLLNMLGALGKPTSGEIFIDGVKISEVPERNLYRIRREKIGFVFQNYYLVPTLTAIENVLIPTIPMGQDSYRERARYLLNQVGLEERIYHRPFQLSGGEQQRVAIARALINDPKIILADEPTGNLDSKTGDEIIKLLTTLNKEKDVTLISVTHDERIAKIADRTVNILDGKIRE
ncbi:MAG TPA: ABC transporter ATP-binding protein [candidate division WWE3 bacterium]|uniref:ABC transporter ATP-binding protein n=1 Tax=candidate division WWE3 bacterium TaxID=2053526 RepID=A0A7C1NQB7_UNCKA|nr:ABC transporter ATP-binding protein [candidate division WWE3 bacterium]